MKLRDYFLDKNDGQKHDYKAKTFTSPSNWTPADHQVRPETLNTIQCIVSSTENLLNKHLIYRNQYLRLNSHKENLTRAETESLSRLKNNSSIVIKPADKGSATVIMNKSSYMAEAYRQLNNSKYYMRIKEPLLKLNISKINEILNRMLSEKFISYKQFEFLQAKDSDRHRVFYLLPKIHKPREKWPRADMPEGRPIVSDCGSESYRVSQFIDSFLKPISIKHPAYLRDTYDFVSKIKDRIVPKGAILVTGDVSSLYTNMKIDRTLSVTRDALHKHRVPGRPDKYIMQLLEVTLKNNDFCFNGEYFLQTCGTAMGKTYAPSLADLYLEEFDYKAMYGFRIKPLFYFRFLDDIFFVWTGTLAELTEYEIYLNSLIDGIKVTLTASESEISFLDTTIYKMANDNVNDILQTKVFFKDTDTHQLLHKASFHPKHTTKGVLKSQLLRFKRISSSYANYSDSCSILFKALRQRGYSRRLMRQMKREIWLSEPRSRDAVVTDQDILPIVIPYNDVGCKLAKLWKSIISLNPNFSGYRLITAFSNGQNLSKKLVHSSMQLPAGRQSERRPTLSTGNSCRRCTSIRCKACNYITEGARFRSAVNDKTFTVRGSLNCTSKNLVYLVSCRKCNQQYVGETGRTLGERICDHLSCIRLKKPTPIGLHFNQAGHSVSDFTAKAIEQFSETDTVQVRRMKETTWQTLLQTAYPYGINNLKTDFLPSNRLENAI